MKGELRVRYLDTKRKYLIDSKGKELKRQAYWQLHNSTRPSPNR